MRDFDYELKKFSFFNFANRYALVLIAVIVISFFLQFYRPYIIALILIPQLVPTQPWRLVTHIFLHGSFSHLFFNILFMLFFAPRLEEIIGSKKFLALFFLCGAIAGLGQSLAAPLIPSLGASGALSGVLGCLAVLRPRTQVLLYFVIPLRITHMVVIFAAIDFISAVFLGNVSPIAHVAHLSGLFAGVLFGVWYKNSFNRYS